MARESQTYINTMVFSIIAGLVSIAMLVALMLSESLNAYMFLIITIEMGLLAIIIHALYRVIAYEAKVRKAINNASSNAFAADNCPDYYTLKYSTSGSTEHACRNFFKGRTPDGRPFIMYFVPSDTFKSTGQGSGVVFPGNPSDDSIKIKTLENLTSSEACRIVQGLPAESDSKKDTPNNYSIPWTDLRPKCETIMFY
jgi:hypothetical protein